MIRRLRPDHWFLLGTCILYIAGMVALMIQLAAQEGPIGWLGPILAAVVGFLLMIVLYAASIRVQGETKRASAMSTILLVVGVGLVPFFSSFSPTIQVSILAFGAALLLAFVLLVVRHLRRNQHLLIPK